MYSCVFLCFSREKVYTSLLQAESSEMRLVVRIDKTPLKSGRYPVSLTYLPSGRSASAGRICVFCGSSVGASPTYLAEARSLGQQMASRGWGLVYGGTSVGLMGATADAVLSGGGEVIGVLPQALQVREIAHQGLTKLHMVGSMHERKALVASLSDAFIALPRGL